MGACLSKDTRRSREDESLSRISENTIFQPEEPFNNMSSLAKPPQLTQLLEIRTFEQQTNRARHSLVSGQAENKNLQEFLKNDSISVFIGRQVEAEEKQKAQKMGAANKAGIYLQGIYGGHIENCQCPVQLKAGVFGKYSVDLGENRQKRSPAISLTRSVFNAS